MTRLTAYAKHISSLVPASLLTIKKSSLMLGLFFLTALYVSTTAETVVVGVPNTLDTLHAQNPTLYPGESTLSFTELPSQPGSGILYASIPEINLATGEKLGTRYYGATPRVLLEYGVGYAYTSTSSLLHGQLHVGVGYDDPPMAPIHNTGNATSISGLLGPTYDNTATPIYNEGTIGEISVNFVLNKPRIFLSSPEYFVYNDGGTILSFSSNFIRAYANKNLILNTGDIPLITSTFLLNSTGTGPLIYNTGTLGIASDFYLNYSPILENGPGGSITGIAGDFVENVTSQLIVNNAGSTGSMGPITGNFVANRISQTLIDNADGDIPSISGHFLQNVTDDTLISNTGGTVTIDNSIFVDNTGPYLIKTGGDAVTNVNNSHAYFFADSGTKPNVSNQGNSTLNFTNTHMDTTVENATTFNLDNSWVSGISGTGTTNITGDTDFTPTTVTGNTVNVNSDTLTVASTTFDNTVTLRVANGATVDMAENAVTVQDATFASGSTLALKINAADDHGLFSANTITVADGANLQVTFAHGIAVPTDIQLLSATGSTDFNNFTDVFDNNMYRFTKKDLNGWYTIARTKTAEEISRENDGTMENQKAAAAWVDGPAFPGGSAVADDLALLAQTDGVEFNKELTALAPTDAPVAQAVATHQQDVLLHTVASHLRDERPCFTPEEGLQVWVKGYGGKAKLSQIRNHYGFDMENYGGIFGIEKALQAGTAGMGIQYDKAEIDGFRRETDAKTHTVFAYGEYKPSDWYVNGLFSYGISNWHEEKHVLGDTYRAHWHARSYGARVLTGYDGDYFNPELEARYQHLAAERYKDGLGQHVGSEDTDILTLRAGVRKSWLFGCTRFIKPEIYVGAGYDVISDRENSLVRLNNGTSYHVYGQRLDRLSAQASVGVSVEMTEHLWGSVSYLGLLRKDYREHTGIVGLTYWF